MPALARPLCPILAGIAVAAPLGDQALLFLLALALDANLLLIVVQRIAARLTRRRSAPEPGTLYILRRTVPHLRARRPFGVVEAQVQWRIAAEKRREGRGLG